MFTNEHGRMIQEHPFSAAWRTAKSNAGTPEWATPHDLRHYYASGLIRSGNSVKVLQARLGHASAKTTLDVYAHCSPTRRTVRGTPTTLSCGGRRSRPGRRKAAEKLTAGVSGASGSSARVEQGASTLVRMIGDIVGRERSSSYSASRASSASRNWSQNWGRRSVAVVCRICRSIDQ